MISLSMQQERLHYGVQGVYQIRNIINDKKYIGSSNDIQVRLNKHISLLKKNLHHSRHLQAAYNKYGDSNFTFELLEEVDNTDSLREREQFYLDEYQTYFREYGYNTLFSTTTREGYRHSEETKVKISRVQIGKKLSTEHKLRISSGLRGKIRHNETTRKIIGDKNRRKWMSKTTENEIKEKLIRNEESARKIAKDYGFSVNLVMRFKRKLEEEGEILSLRERNRLIKIDIEKGLPLENIARKYGVTERTVRIRIKEIENMDKQIKYLDIVRLGHKTTVGVLNVGDMILIQEKLDGANASFKRNGDIVEAFSRNTQLSPENNLRGFYEWTQTLDPSELLDGVIYFGEWLVKHKLDYGVNANQFYLFDIYNEFLAEYVDFSMVKDESKRLNLNLIPLFYEGEYVSFDHLQTFVGKSVLGAEGEGIVVKNVKYKDNYDKQCFVKLVTDSFREVQKQKAPKDPNFQSVEMNFVNECLTKARVDKLLHKLVDENLLDESFGIEDMGTILKHLGNRVYDDIMKEETDSLESFEEKDIRKCIGKKLPVIIKSILNERQVA